MSAEFFHGDTNLSEVIARIIDYFDAIRANRAHEALGNKRLYHRGEQKRFHVHVEQTCNATYRVICVQCAEDKVTCHRGANCNIRSLDVSNLANHDHIRVLSQNVSQAFGESQINLWFHVDLRDTRDSIFDRFFNCNDPALHRIDAAEKTIKRGRFPAAGRTREEDNSVRLGKEIPNDLFLLIAQIESLKIELLFAAA